MTDTICALATTSGGALGIIRISGDRSLEILSHIFSKDLTTAAANTIHYGHILDGTEVVDEVMVSIFRTPHSYTGEDAVEISCHGSAYILNKVLELLIQNGCRMANPGEFTMRAYLNGKMDLSQAEAVADLIASTNNATHHMAMSQLRGHFSSELAVLREELLRLTSLLELELDFSDHEDLEFADRTEILQLASLIDKKITTLAQSFETGQALKQGIPVAIVGKTNVGKSTLLNHLMRDDRAIVSDIHGTTRDTIEDTIDLHGVTFRFIDTAGIRPTTDEIEQIGIQRTYQAISKARIIIWMFDDQPSEAEERDMTERCREKMLIPVFNKSDIASAPCVQVSSVPVLNISAKYGQGIDSLEESIFKAADIPAVTENDVIVTSARHYQVLLRAHDELHRVILSLQDQLPADLVAENLRMVLVTLAEITGGQITPQETLNNIFSHFCVGK